MEYFFLENIDFMPKEVCEKIIDENFFYMNDFQKNKIARDWLLKWILAMEISGYDYKKYLHKKLYIETEKIFGQI